MTKTLWELQQDRAQEEAAALASISDAASAAADVNINTEANGRLLDVLNRGQQDRLVAEKQVELLREAREAGKDAYEECHLRYSPSRSSVERNYWANCLARPSPSTPAPW